MLYTNFPTMMNDASDFEGYIKNKQQAHIIYIRTYIHNYAYVMYIYLFITLYVCNIINICNIYTYIYIMYVYSNTKSPVKLNLTIQQIQASQGYDLHFRLNLSLDESVRRACGRR